MKKLAEAGVSETSSGDEARVQGVLLGMSLCNRKRKGGKKRGMKKNWEEERELLCQTDKAHTNLAWVPD